jgi:GTP cyclohydrolase II
MSSTEQQNKPGTPKPPVEQKVSTRLPIEEGGFRITLFKDGEGKDHLSLVMGEVEGQKDVLTRVHSECMTGDLFGSLRCDCGPQLRQSLQMIAEEGTGILIYLRQEGRGIGLVEKLKAYNLQDEGYDTVEANIMLGHKAEERNYTVAAEMIQKLGVSSICLLSNNPAKFNGLQKLGIRISARMPLNPRVTKENLRYLSTKVSRMSHMLDMRALSFNTPEREEIVRHVARLMNEPVPQSPFVSLFYIQSLDGRIADLEYGRVANGNNDAYLLKHQLRALHDAVIFDLDYISASEHTGIIKGMDSELFGSYKPIVVSRKELDAEEKEKMEAMGAELILLPVDESEAEGPSSVIKKLLDILAKKGYKSVMVEASPGFITEFLQAKAADLVVAAVKPTLGGSGTCALDQLETVGEGKLVTLEGFEHKTLGTELIYFGRPDWVR